MQARGAGWYGRSVTRATIAVLVALILVICGCEGTAAVPAGAIALTANAQAK